MLSKLREKSNYLLPPAYVVRREGNSFTLFVCPHLGGGGYPYPIMLCNISQNAMRQRGGTQTPPGGYPDPPGGYLTGYPPFPPGGYPDPPGGYLTGYPPSPPGGVPDRVPPPGGYPGRTTEGVLTTRRAVCLLRSRRRTFLFNRFLQRRKPSVNAPIMGAKHLTVLSFVI